MNDVKHNQKIEIKTDLALETKESFEGTMVEIPGVLVDEKKHGGIKTTVVDIFTKEGAKLMKKPLGSYITLEIDENIMYDNPKKVAKILYSKLSELIKSKNETILVVGLGNESVTPDALGPNVTSKLKITRKIFTEKGICQIAPGVMVQSGMESAEVIKGIVDEIKPGYVIAIDSLAARCVKRLCTTIQLTDTGITPGSGVGNNRVFINEEYVGVPVIAIGVPMVVDAATIVNDTMDALISVILANTNITGLATTLSSFNESERYDLIKELLEPQIGSLYVTPKDIDDNVEVMSSIIAEGINMLKSNQ